MEAVTQTNMNENNEMTSPVFFPVSPKKLAIMSICTFGIYEIYWFYRNWKFLKESIGLNIRPFWRALFRLFFCHSLFENINNAAQERNIRESYKPWQLASAYILLIFTQRAPDPIWLITFFTFVPLITVQNVINALNQNQPKQIIDSKFSKLNIFGIIVGAIAWCFLILGMISPE